MRMRHSLLLILLSLAVPVFAQQLVDVERVVDGDTIVVKGIGKVRLIGVDTPETVHPNKAVQFFGKEASAFTHSLLDGKQIRLGYDQTRKDRYGRTLAYVYLPDSTFVNAELIKQGYGHAYTSFPFKFLEQFRAYEREARQTGKGMWAVSVVYIVRTTGKKYHRDGCRFLSGGKIPITLEEARKNYEPCVVCQPPR